MILGVTFNTSTAFFTKQMARNNHDRPEFQGNNLQQLLSETRQLESVSLVFSEGRICDIASSDPSFLTYMRNIHHLERYQFLKHFLSKYEHRIKNILEVGVGEGNGLNELLNSPDIDLSPENIIGLEIDSQIAQLCQQNNPQLTVVQDNVLAYTPQQAFDLVVCFELLGNESLESDELLLQKIKSLTAAGGLVAMSIAIFDESEFGRQRKKYYSSRIYNRRSFAELFEKTFPGSKKSFYGQFYPLKRFRDSDIGVWPNPDLTKTSDFAIVVVRND